MREQMSLKVRKQTSSLVFIFLFCICLKSTACKLLYCKVSLYTYVYLHLFYLDSHIFLSELLINPLNAVTMLWNTTNCHLFVHSFNIVLRILFAKKLAIVACTFVHIFIFK